MAVYSTFRFAALVGAFVHYFCYALVYLQIAFYLSSDSQVWMGTGQVREKPAELIIGSMIPNYVGQLHHVE